MRVREPALEPKDVELLQILLQAIVKDVLYFLERLQSVQSVT
jgi:hypothetical protein